MQCEFQSALLLTVRFVLSTGAAFWLRTNVSFRFDIAAREEEEEKPKGSSCDHLMSSKLD